MLSYALWSFLAFFCSFVFYFLFLDLANLHNLHNSKSSLCLSVRMSIQHYRQIPILHICIRLLANKTAVLHSDKKRAIFLKILDRDFSS